MVNRTYFFETEEVLLFQDEDEAAGALDNTPDDGRLPPRPADYDYYWYEDDDGNWRNEYDDEGYEFAEPDPTTDKPEKEVS